MAKGTKIAATFADGTTITRTTTRTLTHAFQVKATRSDADAASWSDSAGNPRKHVVITGFGGSHELARKGAAYYTGAAAGWESHAVEIVEVRAA